MISIIICSKTHTLFKAVSDNIKETIGVAYEIIGIDNSEGKYSICKAYNIGAAKAQYDIFCFAHEDILFVTPNWGLNVIYHLKDEEIGLIGTLGAGPALIVPVVDPRGILEIEANMIFVDVNTGIKQHAFETATPNDKSVCKETTGVDGTLMITRRNVYYEFKFDDELLTDFHGYDADFSLQVQSKYKVCVVFDILLEHYFKGGANKNFVKEMLKISKKWKGKLPISHKHHSYSHYSKIHWQSMIRLMEFMIRVEFKRSYIFKQFIYLSFNRFFRPRSFIYILNCILIKKLLKTEKKLILHPQIKLE